MSENDNTMRSDASTAADQQNGGGINEMLAGSEDGFGTIESEKKPLNQSTLVLLGILMIGAVGTYFMYLKAGPRAADAAAAGDANSASQTISQFLESGQQNVDRMRQTLQDTQKIVQEFKSYPNAPELPLATNPFRDLTGKDVADTGDADSKARREAERAEVLQAAGELQLQSIMYGGETRKSCMINNTLYQEGQQVDRFTIEKISPNAIIVRSGQYRFELKIQK